MCAVEGCAVRAHTRGWCRTHYQRWRRHGDPTRERPDIDARLRRRSYDHPDGCRVWTAAHDRDGYGLLKVDGRMARITRLVWERANGPIADGLIVMHSCDNPPCIRLEHLSIGTHQDNARDALTKVRRPQNLKGRPWRGRIAA